MEKIFDDIQDAIADVAMGKPIVVVDDENRENEGDLIVAASKITPEAVNIMISHCKGLICAPATTAVLNRLGIDDMVKINRDKKGTAFTVTVDAADGITTGISAADRARTLKLMAQPTSTGADFVSPGHINPLRARPGGVLERAGHTEAAVDMCKLANLPPVGVICEIIKDDGTMARLPDIIEFKNKFGYRLISVASLIEYRLKNDRILKKISSSKVDTEFGEFDFSIFRNEADKKFHFALSVGDLSKDGAFARVHAQNIFADLFRAKSFSDAADSFRRAMAKIAEAKCGALVCVNVENWGVDINAAQPILPNKVDYGIGSQILKELGFKKINLLTTHPGAHYMPEGYGLQIVSQTKI